MIRVEGCGNRRARVAFVGERPGIHELKQRQGFVGPSGEILWQMAYRECGLRREDVWTTNLIKTEIDEKWERDGIPAAVLADAGEDLDYELSQIQPAVIVMVGRYAMRHFLGPWATVQICNAKTFRPLFYDGATCAPTLVGMMHPAAALREGSQLAWTQEAFEVLDAVLKNRGPEPVREHPPVKVWSDWDSYYRDVLSTWIGSDSAMDTEFDPRTGRPWGLSFAVDDERALVLRAADKHGLRALLAWLKARRPRVWLHYMLADLQPLRDMGIDLIALGLELKDSNLLAFHQQTLPQGLKALARRELGLEMRDYEDVVGPYERAMADYLLQVLGATTPRSFERRGKPTKSEPEGKLLKPGVEPASRLHKLVRRALSDYNSDSALLRERWKNWEAEPKAEARAIAGVAPSFSLDLVPDAEADQYAGTDAAATVGIARVLEGMPRAGMIEVIDHDVLPQVDAMQQRGLQLNERARKDLEAYLDEELNTITDVLRAVTGDSAFNPASADDVRRVLFGMVKDEASREYTLLDPSEDELDLEYAIPVQYTRAQAPKTDKKSLALLSAEHTLPPLLLHYRMLQKLQTTYVRPLPRFMKNGVIHPRFSVTRVASGRLAARDPNLMAFPTRSALGKRIRSLFEARDGMLFGAWDLGGIELRVMADDARDAQMLKELSPGYPYDMHTTNAAMFFGLRYEDIPKESVTRTASKTITFGIAYGAEARRLHFEALVAGFDQYTVDDFERFLREWFKKYSGVDAMRRETERLIRLNGYIEDRFGRVRKLPAVRLQGNRWPMIALREEAIRQGQNHRVQGGAQEIMKRAQKRFDDDVFPAVRRAGFEVFPVLQVHDELMTEFGAGALAVIDPLAKAAMTADSWMFDCGLTCDANYGTAWSDI
jgi:uracil-DNA glycosylase family 4